MSYLSTINQCGCFRFHGRLQFQFWNSPVVFLMPPFSISSLTSLFGNPVFMPTRILLPTSVISQDRGYLRFGLPLSLNQTVASGVQQPFIGSIFVVCAVITCPFSNSISARNHLYLLIRVPFTKTFANFTIF